METKKFAIVDNDSQIILARGLALEFAFMFIEGYVQKYWQEKLNLAIVEEASDD